MNYKKATLKDKVFQDLIKAKADIQIKEMVDRKWYPEEIAEIEEIESYHSVETLHSDPDLKKELGQYIAYKHVLFLAE